MLLRLLGSLRHPAVLVSALTIKAEVVQCVNNWFDTMNSRTNIYKPDDETSGVNKYKSALGTYWPVQEQALLQMLELMEGLVRTLILVGTEMLTCPGSKYYCQARHSKGSVNTDAS